MNSPARTAGCPSCGAPLRFRGATSIVAVCGFCRATVVREGGLTVSLVLGSPGGPRIVTALIQVLLRTEVYGQTLEEAVRAPRLHQQWSPTVTSFEEGWDPLLLQELRNRDHAVEVLTETFGAVQAIRVEAGGEPEGVSDPRRSGLALAERVSERARPRP